MTKLPKQGVPSSTQLGSSDLGNNNGELAFDPRSGRLIKRTHVMKEAEKQCCGRDGCREEEYREKSKVPIVVSMSRIRDSRRPLDAPESEHPHCILPKHYFDAFLARASSQAEENGSRSLFSIETWDGRQVISYDSIES